MLLVYFALYIVAVYLIARRVAVPWIAALVTFLCACISVPMYSEGLPSWYNLFFATFGTLALLQHADSGNRRWLFWAGCCAGCSLLVKITGMYFVAAAFIYIAYREQCRSACEQDVVNRFFSVIVCTFCLLFGVLGLLFARGPNPLANAAHFSLPIVAIGIWFAWSEWQTGRGSLADRIGALAADTLPFVGGIACLLVVFMIPYAVSGSLWPLYRGLFVLPAERLEHAAMSPPDLKWLSLSVPVAWLAWYGSRSGVPRISRRVQTWLLAGLCLLFFASATESGYFYLFQSLRNLIPLMVLVGLFVLFSDRSVMDRQPLLLLTVVTALASLIQYPYAYGTYFFYAAPLLILTILYVVAHQAHSPRRLWVGLLLFAILFAFFRLPQPDPRLLNGFYRPEFPLGEMNLPRCNLVVYDEDARVYDRLVELVDLHAPDGGYIYAAPDCPELYFLSGRRNPTRTLYDLFACRQKNRPSQLFDLLDRCGVNLVAINCYPPFSARLTPEFLRRVENSYPHQQSIFGSRQPDSEPVEMFRVYWRTQRPRRG
jgi:hypothetical protein